MEEIKKVLRRISAERDEGEEVRRSAFTPEVRAVNEESRCITFVSSTEAKDRYGDVIRVAGWRTESYMRNPVFLWAHNSGEPPIGKCIRIAKETSPKPALVQTVEFADAKTYPFADSIYKLYKGKFLNSVSVGFRPLERPKAITDANDNFTGYEFTSQELLELSAVPIPANPEAVARAIGSGVVSEADAARAFGEDEEDEVVSARAVLAAQARRAGLPVVRCGDQEAVLRARLLTSISGICQSLESMKLIFPLLPQKALEEFNRSFAEDEFIEALMRKPVDSLDQLFGLLNGEEL